MKPTEKTPALDLNLINGTKWSLAAQAPESFTMLVFYRGLHCPVCKKNLEELKTKLKDFTDRGVNVLAASMDSEERAKKSADKWDIESIPLAYGMKEETARKWGLYISNAISDKEPDTFSEPGLFLIRPDGTLYSSSVQTMPFARPGYNDLLKAIDFIKKEEYPARGSK